MKYNLMGDSDLSVSALGIGCWPFGGGYWGDQSQEDVKRVVHGAIDSGINFFDNAEGYSGSEESLGNALDGKRSQVIICDKVGIKETDQERTESLHGALNKLKTDYIDLYMIHWPSRDKQKVIDTLLLFDKFRREGKIRHIGVSNFGMQQMGWIEESGVKVIANQLCYNIACRAIESAIWPMCKEVGYGVVGYMPIMQGLLTGKYKDTSEVPYNRTGSRHFADNGVNNANHREPGVEAEMFELVDHLNRISARLGISTSQLSLAYSINKGITSTIAGIRDLDQLEHNNVAAGLDLSAEVMAELDALSNDINHKLGNSPDLYVNRAESRIY
ncbi:aldo/keto reductase [Paenibacillus sp. BC26]|uniref:aldo/keto reductase n=1 Tax=Paenibacillus sp. BC26 TaxID=1881032 RepID=UPI0008F3C8E9|nr:aldo/keto reductase [Paenibacillus sp. BC26]SFS73899.1 Predicted oxidoreductase [Paenibacillus sp. BC26]